MIIYQLVFFSPSSMAMMFKKMTPESRMVEVRLFLDVQMMKTKKAKNMETKASRQITEETCSEKAK